ncbi:MAG: Hsp20/alpha crystallin family protein [Bdellovibrio sp.]
MPLRPLSPWTGFRGSNLINQFEDFFNDFDRGLTSTAGKPAYDFLPPIDLQEDENAFLVTIDLPGMKKNEIKIDCTDNVLTISGERVRDLKGESKYTERPYGTFLRTFTLPSQVDVNSIKAVFEDGVLKVSLPKSEESKARTIKIS